MLFLTITKNVSVLFLKTSPSVYNLASPLPHPLSDRRWRALLLMPLPEFPGSYTQRIKQSSQPKCESAPRAQAARFCAVSHALFSLSSPLLCACATLVGVPPRHILWTPGYACRCRMNTIWTVLMFPKLELCTVNKRRKASFFNH